MARKSYLMLVLYLLVVMIVSAQTNSTKGRDFWVMFLYNHNYNSGSHTDEQRLYIMGDQTTSISITNNTTGTVNATLTAPSFSIMHNCGSNQLHNHTVFEGGYHITASEDVWIYADNYIDNNQDVSVILPIEALDTHYIVQDYPSTNDRGAEVGMLATEDSTVITMTVPCNVLNSTITAGTPLSITLNTGQAYMLLAAPNGSFGGMEVTSNGKPFAMFVAGQNTAVPTSGSGRDFTYEQAVPVSQWGTEFIVCGSTRQSVNRLRITSSANNCTVYQNGTFLAGPLLRGETYEAAIPPNDQWHLTTTKPVQVILYLGSYQTAGNIGDPSSITIPPLDKGLDDYYFPNISSPSIQDNSHYIRIICHQMYDGGLTLDNAPLPSNSTVSTLGDYRCHRVTLPSNSTAGYRLKNSLGPFIAYAYGLGNWESYGYTLGFSIDTVPIPEPVNIYDTICQGAGYDSLGLSLQPAQTQTAGELHYERDYQGVHYVFHLTVMPVSRSDVYDSIALGDTMTWNGVEVTAAGEYTVTLTDANGCDSVVTLHLFYIGSTVDFYDTLCAGNAYSGHGFSVSIVTADTVMARDTVEDDVPKHYVLHLTALPNAHTDINLSIINGDTVAVCDTLLSVAGDYTFHYTSANGCDSTVVVHLAYETVGIHASKEGVCPGEEVTLTATGTHTYIWSASPYDPELDAQQGINPIVVHPMQTTVYSLLDAAGNVLSTVSVGTEAAPLLCVEVNRDILDFDNPVLLFTDCSEGRYSTSWHFADGRHFTGEKIRRRYYYPLPDSAVVTMTSCNRYNCCADTTIAIPMKILSVWFPNVFTPDEDNNNLFQCFTSFDVEMFELIIYNRWGLLMWSSEDVNEGWDGRRTDGTPCTQGAYAYKYYLKSTDGTVRHGSGTVTIIR